MSEIDENTVIKGLAPVGPLSVETRERLTKAALDEMDHAPTWDNVPHAGDFARRHGCTLHVARHIIIGAICDGAGD